MSATTTANITLFSTSEQLCVSSSTSNEVSPFIYTQSQGDKNFEDGWVLSSMSILNYLF